MEQIRKLRKKKGLTMRQAASDLGMPYTTYVNYEKGLREPNSEKLLRIAEYFGVSVDVLLGREAPEGFLPLPQTEKIPLLGTIACGEPILANEELDLYVVAGSAINADFCLKAKGDSMIGARIYDGDIVFIKKQPIVENGEIAAVLIGDEATLKRVYYDQKNGILQLFAENPQYQTMRFSKEEINQIRIIGKAVAFQSDIK